MVNGALFKLTLRDYKTVVAHLRRSSSSSVGARARGLVMSDRVARGENARVTPDSSDTNASGPSAHSPNKTEPKADTPKADTDTRKADSKQTAPSPSSSEAAGKDGSEAKAQGTQDALTKDLTQDTHGVTDGKTHSDSEQKNKDPDVKPL